MKDLLNYKPYMELALQEAKKSFREGNNGFGAVIVKDGQVIAQSRDKEITGSDSTSHAVLNAIKFASKLLGHDLRGCKLITTREPCPMCAAAIVWCGITKVVYGQSRNSKNNEGEKRSLIGCEEMFKREGAKIEIKGGLLEEECSCLYNSQVREEVIKLRNCNTAVLEKLSRNISKKRGEWFRKNKKHIKIDKNNLLESAYRLLLAKLEISEDEMEVVEKTGNKYVLHSKNFCPTLEACLILGLDTTMVCSKINERPTDEFVKKIHPSLSFKRNYSKLRPREKFCEEFIILK